MDYQARKAALQRQKTSRIIRIMNDTIGEDRVFSGEITISQWYESAYGPDEWRLKGLALCQKNAFLYWTDGSLVRDKPSGEKRRAPEHQRRWQGFFGRVVL